ncbi:MAG: hypothetical protein HN509_02465 [Halobacteriovoraceae bacterium]|nr:hypothetical protein [Halobacteriovoraceae bacterium]MBT5093055.1 hypothetical protein [Halobacteriovoraceae bacterium]
MKKLFATLILMTIPLSSLMAGQADEELNFTYQLPRTKLIISKMYVGEPVSQPRILTVTQVCKGEKKQLYKSKKCDFNQFVLVKGMLNFKIRYYDSVSGVCTSPKAETKSITYSVNCK